MLTLTPEARRCILGPKPTIGSHYFCDRETNLRITRPNYPTTELPFNIQGPYKKSEPPVWKQVLLGILIASTLLLACFL